MSAGDEENWSGEADQAEAIVRADRDWILRRPFA
jgi:hypothetical protein